MFSNLTIGKKLYLGFGVGLLLTIGLGLTALSSISTLSGLLRTAVTSTAQKQRLAGEINASAADLLALSRGMEVRGFLKDNTEVDRYNRQYQDESDKLKQLSSTIAPLLVLPEATQLVAQILALDDQMAQASQQVHDAAVKGDMDSAVKAYERFLPAQEKLRAAASRLTALQNTLFADSTTEADQSTSRARWITGVVLLLAFLVGVITVFVVRQITSVLLQSARELDEASVQIASAASQVAASSQGMAQGASEQAATIEETSASSSEINSMAQRNTENSSTTAEMVTRSQQRFEETNGSLVQMVEAMDDITSSSQKISKIIKVIDEIAFQTNILALNAAVEAARAGDAGMGFAVVADEVRNLAQRCAQAAKDTSSLIEDSIQKSDGGKAKVDQVASAIRSITADSSKMKVLVDEIKLGSVEQARGIDQISRSIVQMEQVTQSSAANAEEGAAAAEQLSAQAQMMKDVVDRLTRMVDNSRPAAKHATHNASTDAERSRAAFATKAAPVMTIKPKANSSAPKSAHAQKPVKTEAFPMDDDFKEF